MLESRDWDDTETLEWRDYRDETRDIQKTPRDRLKTETETRTLHPTTSSKALKGAECRPQRIKISWSILFSMPMKPNNWSNAFNFTHYSAWWLRHEIYTSDWWWDLSGRISRKTNLSIHTQSTCSQIFWTDKILRPNVPWFSSETLALYKSHNYLIKNNTHIVNSWQHNGTDCVGRCRLVWRSVGNHTDTSL